MSRWPRAMVWAPRLRAIFKWLGIFLVALVLAGYVISAYWTVGWEGPSDWGGGLYSGGLWVSMTNIGREHFRGPYGRGWSIHDGDGSINWGLDDSTDYGPYSVMV